MRYPCQTECAFRAPDEAASRPAGRNAKRVASMRRTVEVQRDQLAAASRRPRERSELARRRFVRYRDSVLGVNPSKMSA